MEIFKEFGIEPLLVGAEILNFLIIFYVLKRFLYKPVFNILKKRETAIKEGIEKAEEGKQSLEKAQQEEKKILKKAHETATQIVGDAREEAASIVKKAEDKAKVEAARIIDDAKTRIDIERKEAESKILKDVSRLSVELLRKSLSKILSDKEQDAIVKRAITVLQKQN